MIIFFNSNHYNSKYIPNSVECQVSMPNKPSVNYFIRESTKNAKKNPLKRHIARNFKHINIVFNSNLFNAIIYSKECCLPSLVPIKPNINYFIRESCKKALKTLKVKLSS